MTAAASNPEVLASIAGARMALADTNEHLWTNDRITGWQRALDAIESSLGGDAQNAGFSIIRALDSQDVELFETTAGKALLSLARCLRDAGINSYR